MRQLVRDEGGQAIFLVGIVMLALVMAVGLAVDTGQLFSARRSAQQAADSAAFAGAVLLYQQGCPWAACTSTQVSNATSAATSDASLNGYATDTPTTGTTVTVSSPPSAGSFTSNALCVRVVVSTPVRTTLVPQSEAFTTVKATGTACASQYDAGFALMALDKTCTTKTLQESSNGSMAIHGGNLNVNSCSSSGGYAQNTVTLDSGYGAYFEAGASPWPSVSPGNTTLNTGVVQADPFANTPGPPTTGLTDPQSCAGPTLSPGIYTCTINNGTYTMQSGYYIFKGNQAGINLAGTSTLTGTGVLIYLTTSNYPSSGGTCASFSLGGNNTTTISAATSGPYAGMLIYQDSQCTGEISIGGNGAIDSMTGSIYAPTGSVKADGTNAAITLTQIVANQENVQNGNVTINYAVASAYVGYVPALVE